MLKIWSHIFQPTHLRKGGSDWIPSHGWKELRWETHCNHLHCWIRRTCHQRTRSALMVYWWLWRVSVPGGRQKCLLMPGLAMAYCPTFKRWVHWRGWWTKQIKKQMYLLQTPYLSAIHLTKNSSFEMHVLYMPFDSFCRKLFSWWAQTPIFNIQ